MSKNFKYKVGDKVIVREDLIKGDQYYMENTGKRDVVVEAMLKFRGKTVTINRTTTLGEYKISEDGAEWNWTDEMFSGLANEHWKVVITPNGDETTATLYRGKTVEKKATVKRYSKDTYSIAMACEAVIEKLNAQLGNSEKIVKCDRYEVGDRVKIVKHWDGKTCQNHFGLMDKWLGKIMTISGMALGSYLMKEDNDENGGGGWLWNKHCIEGKVVSEDEREDKTLFKDGDLVEITDTSDAHYGQRGVIFYADTDGDAIAVDFKVKYDDTNDCEVIGLKVLPEKTGRWYEPEQIVKVD